ncbi:hypothetical protein GTP23_22095 [Pseudoduganella sp. FT93W]|uniref:Uncharacterized protein n=1 Tax=Duganella fentianensis TaxID=2692177 RepID=A0A845I3C4_9BURK|nr:hypothetical protein [Duganella fentianensis]MYN47732.1 hypothetical protein [Duganella fentianensis]
MIPSIAQKVLAYDFFRILFVPQLLTEQLNNANDQMAPVKAEVRELELLLAQANAKVQAQEQIGEQLRTYLDKIAATSTAREVEK